MDDTCDPRSILNLAATAVGSDPDRGLRAVGQLRSDLELVERLQVAYALDAGWSWAQIARALGVSRQAIHRKYSTNPPAAPARTPAPQLSRRAKLATVLARTEAAAHGDALVGTEHLLAGLLLQAEGPAAQILTEVGVDVDRLRGKLAALTPANVSSAAPSAMPLSRRARAALDRALRDSVRNGDEEVDDATLLCALIDDPDSGAVYLLAALGVTPEVVRQACAERSARATSGVTTALSH